MFANSQLSRALENNLLSIPKPAPLGSTMDYVPFVFVADDAFPLMMYMLKPYLGIELDKKQCIFNYRLNRARRIVENAFWIMAQRFRVLPKPKMACEKISGTRNNLRMKLPMEVIFEYSPCHGILHVVESNNGS